MLRIKARLREKTNRYLLTPSVRKFLFRLAVKMMASGFTTFTIVFVTIGAIGLVIELIPWLFRRGVLDIDPLPILLCASVFSLASMYARWLIMKKFSHVRP